MTLRYEFMKVKLSSQPYMREFLSRGVSGCKNSARMLVGKLSTVLTLMPKSYASWATLAVVLIALLLIVETFQPRLMLEPLAVPNQLTSDGYTASVTASELHDQIEAIFNKARSTMKPQSVDLASQQPDITVPGTGLSLRTIEDVLHGFVGLGKQQHAVAGEFTSGNNVLRLTLRLDNVVVFDQTSSTGDIVTDQTSLLREAAKAIVERTQPFFVAAAVAQDSSDEALTRIERILIQGNASDENVIDAHVLRGNIYQTQGDFADAESEYKLVLARRPKAASPHSDLGSLYLSQLTRRREAKQEFENALRLERNLAPAHNGLASVLFLNNQYRDATAEYEKAIAIDPQEPKYHRNLAQAYSAEGDLRGALTEYHIAIILDPEYIPGYKAFASVLSGVGDASVLGPAVTASSACAHLKTGYRLREDDVYRTAAAKLITVVPQSQRCVIEAAAK